MLRKIKKIVPFVVYFVPFVALAQIGGSTTNLRDFFGIITDILNLLIPIIIGIAFIYFLAGVIKYVTSGDSEEGRTTARNMMIYGIIALFVMVSVWGLVNVISGSFDLDNVAPSNLPQIPEVS